MGEITTRTREAPPLAKPEIAKLTAIMGNRLEVDGTTKTGEGRNWISLQNAPTDAERSALTLRRNILADGLTPGLSERDDVADAILEMFYAWPDTRRMDAGKSAATASKYASVVSDQPLWAVLKACDQLTREDRDFPPSSGTLRAYALKACASARDELTQLQRILASEVYERTEHAAGAIERVNDVAKSFKERLPKDALRASDYRQHPDAEAERQLAEFDVRRGVGTVDHSKPLTLSKSLQDHLSKPREAGR